MEDNSYDIITLGLYDRPLSEVRETLRQLGVTCVIDARASRTSRTVPALNGRNTDLSAREDGFSYIHLPALDGRTRDPRLHLSFNTDEPVDYSRVMESEPFRKAAGTLVETAGKEKVAVIFSNRNAYNGAAAKLVGQYLSANTGMSVGHVIETGTTKPVISSQEAVINRSLGRGMKVTAGDYRKIAFTSDGRYSAPEDVKIERMKRQRAEQQRTIEGQWNYGSQGEIRTSGEGAVRTAEENAAWGDVTLGFYQGYLTEEERIQKAAGGDRFIKITVPSRREDFLDEEGRVSSVVVSRAVKTINNKIGWVVASMLFDAEGFYPDAVKVNIVGANMARLANGVRDLPVNEEEVNRTSEQKMRNTGTFEVTPDGPDESIIDEYVEKVLAGIREGVIKSGRNGEFDTLDTGYRIGEIRSDGESGIGESAVIACQKAGMKWSINAPKDFPWTKDNETLRGEVVRDEASFGNRFRQGYALIKDSEALAQDAELQARWRSLDEGGLEPGLRDNQIALLQFLNFDNSDITQMIDIARDNGVIITDNAQMVSFIEDCGGYGIKASSYINEAAVENAQEELRDTLAVCREKGISFITSAHPAYPERLAQMQPYTEKVTDTVYTVRDGVASFETVESEQQRYRPAILWYRGDLETLKGKTCAVIGKECSTDLFDLRYKEVTSSPDHDVVLARELGKKLAVAGVSPVVSLQEGSERAAADEAMKFGGRPVVVSSSRIDSPRLSEYADDVVSRGGVVVSEEAPVEKALITHGEEQSKRRARKTMGGLSGAAMFLSGISDGRDLGLADTLVFLGVTTAVSTVTRPLDIYNAFKKKHETRENVSEVEDNGQSLDRFVDSLKTPEEKPSIVKEAAPERKRNTIEMLSIEGRQPVFLVPAGREDIRQAIIGRYGNSVQFDTPGNKAAVMASLLGYPEGVTWRKGDGPWYGSVSACVQKPMVEEETVFVDHDKVYDLASAPDSFPGLKSQKTRQNNIALFDEFRAKAAALQERMQTELDMPSSAAIHFGGARHLVIRGNSVEIREGCDLRARIYLSGTGVIRYENIQPLSGDLSEHYRREVPLLTGRFDDAGVMLEQLLSQTEDALWRRGQGESDELALATREEQEAIAQELETGFRTPGADNADIAARDIMRGIEEGSIADMKLFRIPDAELLYHNAQMSINERLLEKDTIRKERQQLYGDSERMSARVNAASETLCTLADTESRLDLGTRELISRYVADIQDGTSVEQLKADIQGISLLVRDDDLGLEVTHLCNELFRAAQAQEEATSRLQSSLSRERTLTRGIASLEAAKLALAKGEDIRLAARPGDDCPSRYSIGGHLFDISGTDDGTMDLEKTLAAMSMQKYGRPKAVEAAAEKTEIKAGTGLKATPEEVVSPVSNGHCVIERNGRQAYADKDLNIVSAFYEKCAPYGAHYGIVREGGKMNIIGPSGREELAVWAEGVGRCHEGFTQVLVNGKKNLINVETFEYVGERWYSHLDYMSNGWARVENEKGLQNFINSSGELFSCDEWFLKASNFQLGKAEVILQDGTRYTVTPDGTGYAVLEGNGKRVAREEARAEGEEEHRSVSHRR